MAAGQFRGTVLPTPNFHAERAAIKIQKALKGIGTDEKVIIEVLTTHSNNQRQEIKKKYKALYGRDLIEDFKTDLSGHFEDVCLALLMLHEEYLAECLQKATKGIGTDERCLLDILCVQQPTEMESLANIYKEKYGNELENDLKEELSDVFKTLIRSLLSGGRDEFEGDEDKVNSDVQDLITAVNENDQNSVAAILNSRSYPHLYQVFEEYAKTAGKDFEEDVKTLFSSDAEIGYSSLIKIIKNEAEYFAERLNASIKGLGTDDSTLIRIIVTHSEVDLADIKEKYKNLFNKDLSEVIADDTSGDYRKILLKIVG